MDVQVVVVRGAAKEKPVSYRLENGVLEVWMETAGTPPAAKKAEALEGDYWLYLHEQTGRHRPPDRDHRMQRPARGRVQPL